MISSLARRLQADIGFVDQRMKTFLCIGLAFTLALPALAQDKESDRVESAGKVMQEILDAPDSIPKSVLGKAECVVILSSVLKFSFGLGSSYGRGVMTCRGGGKSFHGSWSAPAMMALEGVSAGLQFCGNSTEIKSRAARLEKRAIFLFLSLAFS